MTNEKALLWIMNVKGMTNKKAWKLINAFNSPLDIIHCDKKLLIEKHGLDDAVADGILDYSGISDLLDELYKNDVRFFSYLDSFYPDLFRTIPEPPALLYYKGKLPTDYNRFLSVVGSRRCTVLGADTCFRICKGLAEVNMIVVSGMAKGIDTMAHKGALAGDGVTVAIVGTGLDKCYPAENRGLMNEILKKGCIISEFPLGTKPFAYNFPQRNRLIAAISRGTLVVEAGKRSGTNITVSEALDYGKDIFAVPGNTANELSEGPNSLIKQGAAAVTEASDILSVYDDLIEHKDFVYKKNIYDNLIPEERAIYDCIIDSPKSVWEISQYTGLASYVCQYATSMMEIRGYIRKLPGNLYIKN